MIMILVNIQKRWGKTKREKKREREEEIVEEFVSR